MGIKISKYEFSDEASALSKINALPSVKDEEGNDVPAHAQAAHPPSRSEASEPPPRHL